MITIHCQRKSNTAVLLREAIRDRNVVCPQDVVVNWSGSPIRGGPSQIVLNGNAHSDKLRQAVKLGVAGVPTITVSLTNEGVGWLPRRISHQQGFDFTNRALREGRLPADYFVKKEYTTDEYRVHVARTKKDNLRILRTAVKVPRVARPHPWVRAHRLGWKLSYVGGAPESVKQAARNALRALSLDFGAADIGLRFDGTPCVFEVNTCPGLEGNNLQLYLDFFVERGS